MRVPRLVLLGVIVLAGAAFLAAACGGDEDQDATAPAATAPATEEADEFVEPTEEVAADGATTLDIAMIPTLAFDKEELRAPAGTEFTVRFDNQETGVPHNWALYTDESASEPVAGANENICSAPCTGEVTVGPLEPGTYFFRCDVHPTIMTGTLIVE